jgi:cytochrome c
MSWLVERDVRQGRDHMNFSRWPEYSLQQQQKVLADVASALKNREMPLPQYALMHREAKLSDAEIDIIYRWARLERRRVKAALATDLVRPIIEDTVQH